MIKRVGGWVIYSGAVGLAVVGGCGRTPLGFDGLPGPIGDDDDDGGTSPPPTGSPTPIEPCGCPQVPGVDTQLNVSDLNPNNVAYNSGLRVFVCRDSAGLFYAMSSICTHQNTNIPDAPGSPNYTPSDLGAGFYCGLHGSRFGPTGNVTNGPATVALNHYRLGIDADGAIHVDKTEPLADPSCRCDIDGNEV